jgi:hypothetical protein
MKMDYLFGKTVKSNMIQGIFNSEQNIFYAISKDMITIDTTPNYDPKKLVYD